MTFLSSALFLSISIYFLVVPCNSYNIPTKICETDSVDKRSHYAFGSSTRRSMIATMVPPILFAWDNVLFHSRNAGVVQAAEPVQSKDTDSLLAIMKRKLRPKPPKVLRRKLSQDFAVLLMRSSYNALDELDCVAMDQFQRDFFLIRSSEYQDYTKALGDGMVQQGDLTDPYYFDFISFVQYRTINRELTQDPPYVFQEMQPVEQEQQAESDVAKTKFVSVVVRRDPRLTNAMLVPTHSSKVGSAILDRLDEIFGSTDSRIPKLGNRPAAGTLFLKKIVCEWIHNQEAESCVCLSLCLSDNVHNNYWSNCCKSIVFANEFLFFSLPLFRNQAVGKSLSHQWVCLSRRHIHEPHSYSCYYCKWNQICCHVASTGNTLGGSNIAN
jgi:hypothetical protein